MKLGEARSKVAAGVGQPRSSQRVLLLGLSFIGALFIAEAVIDQYLTQDAEARAKKIEEDSIRSVEILGRIARDVDRERVLVDDHVFETASARMETIER